MSGSVSPDTTRLRFVSSKDPKALIQFLDSLGVRVEVKGNPVFNGKKWFLWFIPSDKGADVKSIEL